MPGLGDAGDFSVGTERILDSVGYKRLYDAVAKMRKSLKGTIYQAFNHHAKQVTGNELAR